MIYFLYFSRFVLPLQQLSITPVPEKAVLRTEYPFRTTGGCCVPGAPENASRTTGGLVAHTNICSVPEKGVSGTEYHSRTREACSAHRAHIPYHRRPSLVPNEPNATNGRGKKPLPQTALPEIQQTPEKRGLFPRQHHRQIPHNRNPVAAGKYLFRRRCSHAWI